MSDHDLDEQIDKLVSDFRTKITKLVQKHSAKILKEQARSLKDEFKFSASPRKVASKQTTSSPRQQRSRKTKDYESDDSDDSD
jgi:hypothetical protein